MEWRVCGESGRGRRDHTPREWITRRRTEAQVEMVELTLSWGLDSFL